MATYSSCFETRTVFFHTSFCAPGCSEAVFVNARGLIVLRSHVLWNMISITAIIYVLYYVCLVWFSLILIHNTSGVLKSWCSFKAKFFLFFPTWELHFFFFFPLVIWHLFVKMGWWSPLCRTAWFMKLCMETVAHPSKDVIKCQFVRLLFYWKWDYCDEGMSPPSLPPPS